MSFSLPGLNLFYLSRDNLEPERYELIIRPSEAWRYICDEYEFDDNYRGTWFIEGIRPKTMRHNPLQAPPGSANAEARLRRMVFSGDVVMLGRDSSAGAIFYIDNTGSLVCRSQRVFEFSGEDCIIREYRRSVACRDYRRSGGKPRPTQFHRSYSVRPSQPVTELASGKPETFGTINSKMAGRLLAAGGVYNQNPEMFAETAKQLGGDAASGFDQVLNEQSAGSLIALSSVLMAGRAGVHPTSVAELEKLKDFLGRYKGEKVLLQNIDVVKMDYIKRSGTELSLIRREFNNSVRKSFARSIAEHPDVISRLDVAQREMLGTGRIPKGYQVHHKLPLEDSGTNDFSNLVLIKNSPEHSVFTTTQQAISRSLTPEGNNTVLWPVPRGVIYP